MNGRSKFGRLIFPAVLLTIAIVMTFMDKFQDPFGVFLTVMWIIVIVSLVVYGLVVLVWDKLLEKRRLQGISKPVKLANLKEILISLLISAFLILSWVFTVGFLEERSINEGIRMHNEEIEPIISYAKENYQLFNFSEKLNINAENKPVETEVSFSLKGVPQETVKVQVGYIQIYNQNYLGDIHRIYGSLLFKSEEMEVGFSSGSADISVRLDVPDLGIEYKKGGENNLVVGIRVNASDDELEETSLTGNIDFVFSSYEELYGMKWFHGLYSEWEDLPLVEVQGLKSDLLRFDSR